VQGHKYRDFYGIGQKVIEPVEECRDEAEIYIGLAERLGVETPLPMKSVEDFLAWQLRKTGKSYDELKGQTAVIVSSKENPVVYKAWEKEGFQFTTPTGKVEFYSKRFEEFGYDPLPYYEEPPQSPYSTPEIFEKYPLILISGSRVPFYYHGAGREIPWLREQLPEPRLEIHPETAEELGISDGDWVWIETSQKEGRVKQKAELTLGIDPRVVHAHSHWWFPERKDDPGRGWTESNINAIMSDRPPYDPISGSHLVRGCLCKIYKVENDAS
jgi:anaerobic selenocysteine-containing dehydrogenase